jgi:ureidoacrylate peracid hydrolase
MQPARQLIVDAKPDALTLSPDQTAVIVVDMQNDFGSPGGMFALAGIDISSIRNVIAPTARVLTAARQAHIAVVYLKMAFLPDLSDAGAIDGPNRIKHRKLRAGDAIKAPDGRPSRILVRDTWNTDIVPELTPHPDDLVLYKSRYSGFYETELDAVLRGRAIKNLIFTGCTTSVCVESTLRDAMFRDYTCLLLADCTAEPGLAGINHDASLLAIQGQFGWVAQSSQFIRAVEELRIAAPAA